MVKNLPASAGDARDVGLIPGSGRYPGEGNGNPLQYSFFFFQLAIIAPPINLIGYDTATVQSSLQYSCL